MYTNYSIPEHLQKHVGKVGEALLPLLTENRIAKMKKVIATRSRQICTVFENTHHAHNVSAVLRTMDSISFLDVFFLYHNPHMNFRSHDSIDRSASKWLMTRPFNEIEACAKFLKNNGYKIALISRPDFSRTSKYYRSDLPAFSVSQISSTSSTDNPEDYIDHPKFLNLVKDQKIALIFGTELYGISEEWLQHADFYLSVDMFGFCESLNVSVCAGIVLNSLRNVLTKNDQLLNLSEFEKNLLLEHWMAKDADHGLTYITTKFPELEEWYLYVRSGKFYQTNEIDSHLI